MTLAIEPTPMDNDESLGSTVITTGTDVPTTSSNTDGTHNGNLLDLLLMATCETDGSKEDSLEHA